MKTYYQVLLEQAKIEKGVPIPSPRAQVLKWDQLEVGDCFTVPCPKEHRTKMQRYMAGYKKYLEKQSKRRYVTRQYEHGVRCWRVK